MLKSLIINNIVLIDKAEIIFDKGLSVLSGETGSGKSILLDALGLAIGFRSNTRLIGNYDSKAIIIAEFDISNNQICKDILNENSIEDAQNPNQIIIRRIISENISSKVFVNDNPIGVNLLAKIGECLVEIHGQHEQQGLLNSNNHLNILDEFANNQELTQKLKKIYEELSNLDREINNFNEIKSNLEREKDYLAHAINEINVANIIENEEQILVQKKDQLIAREKINNFLSDIKNYLTESSSNLLQSQKVLSRNYNLIDNFLKNDVEIFNNLNEISDSQIIEIDESIRKINNILKEINSQQDSKEEIEERLFFIRGLSRKYNCPIENFPIFINDLQIKLDNLQNQQQISLNWHEKRVELLKEYNIIAQKLSAKRKSSAVELATKVEQELEFLKMKGTKFLVDIISATNQDEQKNYFINGLEKVKFKASLNKNDFDEITKIASGGELSRFMLALKVSLINIKSVPTMIFDEIDTGISGSTSDAVGKRLKTLSKKSQILVVTHQPQISSKADAHFKVSKSEINSRVTTKIEILNYQERVEEIARMLSGENITSEAKSVAKNMIDEVI